MACGLPVVSTNVGGLPYLVRTRVDALLVPADNAAAMTRAVVQLLDTPALAAALSAEARRAAAACDWSNQLPRWERLLRSVIADKTAPAILAGRVPDA
jgi:glycosyltransferase involved in cell wall biosynthesis